MVINKIFTFVFATAVTMLAIGAGFAIIFVREDRP